MTEPAAVAPVPRVALTREQAAAALGMSLDTFERHVQHQLAWAYVGRRRYVSVAELERWVQASSTRAA